MVYVMTDTAEMLVCLEALRVDLGLKISVVQEGLVFLTVLHHKKHLAVVHLILAEISNLHLEEQEQQEAQLSVEVKEEDSSIVVEETGSLIEGEAWSEADRVIPPFLEVVVVGNLFQGNKLNFKSKTEIYYTTYVQYAILFCSI